ncbi:MAG: WD40 repeat domain-containing protein, partial [Rubripirellula sp.]
EQRRLRKEQELQTKRANAMRLLAVSQSVQTDSRTQSLLVAAKASESSKGLGTGVERYAQGTLLHVLGISGGRPLASSGKPEEQACFSNDGKWLLAGSGLWRVDAETGPHSKIELQDEPVGQVAIDPKSRWAATGAQDGTVRLFALADDGISPVGQVLKGHDAKIYILSFSPDGRYLATAGGEKVQVWDLEESDLRNPVSVLEPGHHLAKVQFQPVKGRYLVGSDRNQTTVWAIDDGAFEKRATLNGGTFAIHPNGQWLATVSSDKARIWGLFDEDFADPNVIFESEFSYYRRAGFLKNSNKLITSGGGDPKLIWDLDHPGETPTKLGLNENVLLGVSPDGNRLITTAVGGVGVWDSSEGSSVPQSKAVLLGHDDRVHGIAISPDSKWLITCSIGGDPSRVWRLDQIEWKQSPVLLTGSGNYKGTCFSRDGRYLINKYQEATRRYTMSDDNAVTAVWDIPQDEQRTCLSQSRDGTCLWSAVGREDGTVALYDLSQPKPKIEHTFTATDNVAIDNIAVSNDGRFVFTHSEDGVLSLHKVGESGTMPTTTTIDSDYDTDYGSGQNSDRMSFFISSDNRWLASCRDSEGTLWKLDGNHQLDAKYLIPSEMLRSGEILFSPDSHWAATRLGPRSWLWDLTSDDPTVSPIVLENNGGSTYWNLAFSRDGSKFVTGSWHTFATVWDLRAKDIARSGVKLTAHNAVIQGVAAGDDGLIAAGCKSGTIMVWDLNDEDPNALPYRFVGTQGSIGAVDLHPGGKLIASASRATIRLWDLDRDKAIRMARSLAGRELTDLEQKQIAMPE